MRQREETRRLCTASEKKRRQQWRERRRTPTAARTPHYRNGNGTIDSAADGVGGPQDPFPGPGTPGTGRGRSARPSRARRRSGIRGPAAVASAGPRRSNGHRWRLRGPRRRGRKPLNRQGARAVTSIGRTWRRARGVTNRAARPVNNPTVGNARRRSFSRRSRPRARAMAPRRTRGSATPRPRPADVAASAYLPAGFARF